MEEPNLSIELEEEIAEENNLRETSKILIGRIISDKPVLKKRVINFVHTNWRTKKGFSVSYWDKNTYAFQFQLLEDVDKILDMAPWFIRGNLLSLQEWELGKAVDELNFNLCPFWVQIHGLPRSYFTENNVKTIGSSLGTLVSFQGLGVETPVLSYLRLRVVLDVTKPLITCFNVKGKDGNMNRLASIKYEKMEKTLCSGCGKSGNFMIGCRDTTNDLITGLFCPEMKQTYNESFSDKEKRETPVLGKTCGSLESVSLVEKPVVDEKNDDDDDYEEEDDEDRLDSDDDDDDDADKDRLDSDDEDDDDDDEEDSNDDDDEDDEDSDAGFLLLPNPKPLVAEDICYLSSQLQSQAAKQFRAPNLEKAVIELAENVDDVDETGLDPKDIDLVMAQAKVSRLTAVKGLKAYDGDIVSAIMELTKWE